MSLAILFGDVTNPNSLSGAIYLDATISFRRAYKGKVTENPIDSGGVITDHFIQENPNYSIQGVISCVDFSNIPSALTVNGVGVMNSKAPPSITEVTKVGTQIDGLIPPVIQQFLPSLMSKVEMDTDTRESYALTIEPFLKEIMTGLYYNEETGKYENKMTLCTIFDVDNVTATNPRTNVVPVSISIREDAETGDGLFVDLEFQEVRFVTLESAEAPKPAKKSATSIKTSTEKNKGTPPKVDVKDGFEFQEVEDAFKTASGR